MDVVGVAVLLIAIAFILISIGMLLVIIGNLKSSEKSSRIEGGGVIVVGPIPIVIGTSERASKALMVLAIVLTLVALIVFLTVTGYLRIGGRIP